MNLGSNDGILQVIALAAIISPVLVAVINDFFTYKLKKKEMNFRIKKLKQRRTEKIELYNNKLKKKSEKLVSNFVFAANKCGIDSMVSDTAIDKSRKDFAKAGTDLIPLVSGNTRTKVLNWISLTQENYQTKDFQTLAIEINKAAPKLLDEIDKYSAKKSK